MRLGFHWFTRCHSIIVKSSFPKDRFHSSILKYCVLTPRSPRLSTIACGPINSLGSLWCILLSPTLGLSILLCLRACICYFRIQLSIASRNLPKGATSQLIFLRLCISSLLGSPNGAHLILTILLLTHSFCQRIFSNSNQVPGMHIRSGNLALVHNTTLSLPEAKVHSCICFLSP